MYRNFISQSYDPENATTEFFHLSPESNSSITLNFKADRIFNNLYAPFFLQIRTLT